MRNDHFHVAQTPWRTLFVACCLLGHQEFSFSPKLDNVINCIDKNKKQCIASCQILPSHECFLNKLLSNDASRSWTLSSYPSIHVKSTPMALVASSQFSSPSIINISAIIKILILSLISFCFKLWLRRNSYNNSSPCPKRLINSNYGKSWPKSTST